MSNVPVRDPDDRSSRVFPFDGDLRNPIYKMGVDDGVITGSIRYVLSIGNFFFKPAPPDWDGGTGGGGGENPDLIPAMQVIPEALAFEDTEIMKTSSVQTLTITNVGTAPLEITQVIIPAPFAFVVPPVLPMTLQPTQSTTLDVVFQPTVLGATTGVVIFVSNAPTSPRLINLSGTGIEEIPVIPPWTLVGVYQTWARFTSLIVNLPPGVEANDLLVLCISYRDASRYFHPDGWQLIIEENTGFVNPGSRVSTLNFYKIAGPNEPQQITMTARIPGTNDRTIAAMYAFRPRENQPRFDGYTAKEMGNPEYTFNCPSIDVTQPSTLLLAQAGIGDFEGANINAFVATGLSAAGSSAIEFVDDGSRWGQYTYFSSPGASPLSQLSYGLTPVGPGPTGQFVGTAVTRSMTRTVVMAFSGPLAVQPRGNNRNA